MTQSRLKTSATTYQAMLRTIWHSHAVEQSPACESDSSYSNLRSVVQLQSCRPRVILAARSPMRHLIELDNRAELQPTGCTVIEKLPRYTAYNKCSGILVSNPWAWPVTRRPPQQRLQIHAVYFIVCFFNLLLNLCKRSLLRVCHIIVVNAQESSDVD